MRELFARAWGADHPGDVDPFSSCTWWTLGHMIAGLRMPVDGLLVDLGCGRGGTGLWLARATSTRLIGVDFSPAAVSLATARASDFVPPDRADFRVGTFDATGLPDGVADGVISMDALPFAPDRKAAMVELNRILAPDARAVFTIAEVAPGPDKTDTRGLWTEWLSNLDAAGLHLEQRFEDPHRNQRWLALYELWIAHEAELRTAVGDTATDKLIEEANSADPLTRRTPSLLVVRRAGT